MRGITTINLGGEERTLSLKNNFLVLLGKGLDCDPLKIHETLVDIIAENPIRGMVMIVYYGLCAYQERLGDYAHGLKLSQVAEWVDDAPEEELETVWNEFAAIMELPRASEDQIKAYEESLKKNLIQPIQQTEPTPTEQISS